MISAATPVARQAGLRCAHPNYGKPTAGAKKAASARSTLESQRTSPPRPREVPGTTRPCPPAERKTAFNVICLYRDHEYAIDMTTALARKSSGHGSGSYSLVIGGIEGGNCRRRSQPWFSAGSRWPVRISCDPRCKPVMSGHSLLADSGPLPGKGFQSAAFNVASSPLPSTITRLPMPKPSTCSRSCVSESTRPSSRRTFTM